MVSNTSTRQRVLIIGSSSSTGTEIVHALSDNVKASIRPIIFAFCKQSAELDQNTKERCNRIIQGDFTNEADIARAMKKSKCDTVIFAPKDKSSRAALETVLELPQYSTVRLISLSKGGESIATLEPQQTQPLHHEQQVTAVSPKDHKRRSTPLVLRDALEGFSEFWSAVQSITCSGTNQPAYWDDSERSTIEASFAKPWNKQQSPVAPLFTKSLMDVMDVAHRDAPLAVRTFDSEASSQASTPLHLKVSKKDFVGVVVGTVLERGSSSSISEARDILVTAE